MPLEEQGVMSQLGVAKTDKWVGVVAEMPRGAVSRGVNGTIASLLPIYGSQKQKISYINKGEESTIGD